MCSESLLLTIFSTTFDKKLRLEMGQYNTRSLRSMVCFFSSGLTMALVQQHGVQHIVLLSLGAENFGVPGSPQIETALSKSL